MFDILKGMDSAVLHSIPYAADEVIAAGEWVVLNSAGKAVKQTSTYNPVTQGRAYQVFGGTDRLDSQHLGRVTACMGANYLGETDKFAAVTIAAGDPLTIADGVITKATVTGSVTTAVIGYAITSSASGRIRFTRV